MSKKLTYKFIKEYIEETGCKLLSMEYKDIFTKLNILCLCGEEFVKSFHDFKGGQTRCNICAREQTNNKTKLKIKDVKEVILKLGYTLIDNLYINANSKISIKSKEGYKYCVNYGSLQQNHIPKAFNTSNKYTLENIKIWIQINNKGFELISTEYNGNKNKLLWKCDKCGEFWEASWGSIYGGSNCPYCCNQKISYKNSLIVTHPNLCIEWDYSKNIIHPSKVSFGSDKKVWWKCNECNFEWESKINNRSNGKNCPECSESKGEIAIRNFLKNKEINYIPQKEFSGLIGLGGGNLSYDFYLPKYNLLIEYQGIQHEKYIKGLHQSKISFIKQQNHDKKKKDYSLQKGIELLEIWYYDFDNIEEILNKAFRNIKDKTTQK